MSDFHNKNENWKMDFCYFIDVTYDFFSWKERELYFGQNISYHVITVSITSFFSDSLEKGTPLKIWQHDTIWQHSRKCHECLVFIRKSPPTSNFYIYL